MGIIITTGIIIIIIAAVIDILCAPGRMTAEVKETAAAFNGQNVAHRGLYEKDQSIPENSMAAFIRAKDMGYGAELDVHMTKDGQIIVFHDYDLLRACGIDRRVEDMSYDGLSQAGLFGSGEKIPLLGDVLEILGDTPVIIEIKPAAGRNRQVCERVMQVLGDNTSRRCVQSFDPRICAVFKKNAPHIMRGQLACPPGGYEGISAVSAFMLGNLLMNFLSRPHYIAYKHGPLPLIAKLCIAHKPLRAVWTIDDEQLAADACRKNDIIIFEHYRPSQRFKK